MCLGLVGCYPAADRVAQSYRQLSVVEKGGAARAAALGPEAVAEYCPWYASHIEQRALNEKDDLAMADRVIVNDYDPIWPRQFEYLRERAARALSELTPRIEHVGSTAVPGLAAQPIIDLIIQLDDAAQLATAIERLATLGYRHRGNLGITGREAFAAPPGKHAIIYMCAFRGALN